MSFLLASLAKLDAKWVLDSESSYCMSPTCMH
eukprot:SAG31_NODE_7264_length_1738_cov_1.356315_2_plen_31_part_01